MATVHFSLKDTPETRTELGLLLQIDPKQFVHDGLISVEFSGLEDKVLHTLIGAVANHGLQFQTQEKAPARAKEVSKNGSK